VQQMDWTGTRTPYFQLVPIALHFHVQVSRTFLCHALEGGHQRRLHPMISVSASHFPELLGDTQRLEQHQPQQHEHLLAGKWCRIQAHTPFLAHSLHSLVCLLQAVLGPLADLVASDRPLAAHRMLRRAAPDMA